GCGNGGGSDIPLTGLGSPYLFAFAGDEDNAESDFLLVLDVDPGSETPGAVISTRVNIKHQEEIGLRIVIIPRKRKQIGRASPGERYIGTTAVAATKEGQCHYWCGGGTASPFRQNTAHEGDHHDKSFT
ncbi:MAG: hypothetical protein AAGH42_08025, partial [Pseudomonadota bacterium]